MARHILGNTRKKEKRARVQKVIPNNLLLALGACNSQMYPNVHRLLLIACTLPITSAEAERSLSLLRRLKTYARATMAKERFADPSSYRHTLQRAGTSRRSLSYFCSKSFTETVPSVFV